LTKGRRGFDSAVIIQLNVSCMQKSCPFCKKEIDFSATDCSYCHRVLIEKIYNSKHVESHVGEVVSSSRKKYVYHHDQWKKYKTIVLLTVFCLLIVIWIFSFESQSESHKTNYPKGFPVANQVDNLNSEKTYFSLKNGALLGSMPSYLAGLGELKIENGTDMDAVAKLVSDHSNKSVYTVYVKAKSVYSITGISDGRYHLYFAHGRDWNPIDKVFLIERSYSKFEEVFNFDTKKEFLSDGINTEYSVFEITLQPVTGGSAKTEEVSQQEFSRF